MSVSRPLKAGTWLLSGMAAFLALVPWFVYAGLGSGGIIMADGVWYSAVIVLTISIVLSLVSWAALSCATKNITPQGVALGVITGASLVMPFLQVLGPMGGAVVGAVAGFAAFQLQRRISNRRGRPLTIAMATLASAYLVLMVTVLAVQATAPVWEANDGISTWSGTPEGLETSGFGDILHDRIGLVFFVITIPTLAVAGLAVRR